MKLRAEYIKMTFESFLKFLRTTPPISVSLKLAFVARPKRYLVMESQRASYENTRRLRSVDNYERESVWLGSSLLSPQAALAWRHGLVDKISPGKSVTISITISLATPSRSLADNNTRYPI